MNAARTEPDDDRLPIPETEAELEERLMDLESVHVADGWANIKRPEHHRETLRRYALGEIGMSEAEELLKQHGR